MDEKSLSTLELPKILDRLAGHAAFSGGAALARALKPTNDLGEARRWQQETSEARKLLAVKTDVTIGGARDVRPVAVNAARGAVLLTTELMDVKNTIIAARNLRRVLLKLRDQFPRLAFVAERIDECPGLVEAISRTIDERGEVLDSASETLARIRRELRVAHDRLLSKLQSLISNPKYQPYLQEALITQREGRYVLPLKADFKGKLRGLVHDQSASGATLFVEPLATHDMNNEWRELQLKEQEEIRRILAELSAQIGEQVEAIHHTVDALADLDLAFAKAKYAEAIKAVEPALREIPNPKPQSPNGQSAIRNPQSAIRLYSARHPLLDPASVVPIDVCLEDETRAIVITGPNTGGKTVSLKTVGLLALMAQCGLGIPAQPGSELSVLENIFADIGDEQSIEQSLSTFSAHITNIVRILAEADARSLVILDELGAGTDPGEGSALARAILSHLLKTGATTLVATHYPELKAFAQNTPGVANASVEFDLDTLAPTFRLTIGLPGRSNALAIATRLGLDPAIIEDARTLVATTDLEAEKLLDEIHRQRDLARAERAEAERLRAEAQELERKLAARLDAIDEERLALLASARADAQAELEQVRGELEEARRRIRSASRAATRWGGDTTDEKQPQMAMATPLGVSVGAPSGRDPSGRDTLHAGRDDGGESPDAALQQAQSVLDDLEDAQASYPIPTPVRRPPSAVGRRSIRLGDTVYLASLRAEGQVISLAANEAEVQVGRLRVRAKLNELTLRDEPEASHQSSVISRQPAFAPRSDPPPPTPASPGMELDLRGQTAEDALLSLERYLDAAYLAQLPWVRIVHGKGTGKLRQAVRDELRRSPLVKSHEAGSDGEGGDGVTIARLALAG